MRSSRTTLVVIGAICIAAVACSAALAATTSSSGPSAVPYKKTKLRMLGLIPKNKVKKGLHVCFFGDGTTNTYVLANNSGAEQAAKALGVKITVALGDWSGARQLDQMENAISQKQCDGIALESIDPNVVCKAATTDAQNAKIPLAVGNTPICKSKNWTPGTITFAGSQTLDYYNAYVTWVFSQFMKRYPQGGEIATITGPPNWSGTLPPYGSKVSYEIGLKKFPKIKMVQVLSGDFTVEAGLNMAQTILQTHPDIKMFIVQYDQNALGAIQALKSKGKKPGDVMVFGLGCDHSGIANIKNGWETGCFLLEPVEETGWATEAVIAYLSGVPQCKAPPNRNAVKSLVPGKVKCIPKFLWTLPDPTLRRAFGPKASPYVTKANADVITPEW